MPPQHKGIHRGLRFISVLKIILGIIILSSLLLFVFRNYLLKLYIEKYVGKNLGGECRIEKINIFLSGINIRNIRYSSQDAEVTLKRGEINFIPTRNTPPVRVGMGHGAPDVTSGRSGDSALRKPEKKDTAAVRPQSFIFSKPLAFKISQLVLEEGQVKIKRIEVVTDEIKKIITTSKPNLFLPKFVIATPLKLDLTNINLTLPNNLNLDISFSFQGWIDKRTIHRIENITVSDFNMHSNKFEIKNVNLKKVQNNTYLLTLPYLKINRAEFRNLSLPLQITKKAVLLMRTKNELFGPQAYAEGRIDFDNLMNICLSLRLEKASWENIVKMITETEDFAIKGEFSGGINICGYGDKISLAEAFFSNTEGGFINIKGEKSLGFLRERLDPSSYKALIDNLRNYKYNTGRMNVETTGNDLTFQMEFDSQTMGKRNITVTFHDIIRGGEE